MVDKFDVVCFCGLIYYVQDIGGIIRLEWMAAWRSARENSFLNSNLYVEIYVRQPQGFGKPGFEDNVYLRREAINGLKQSSRKWHKLLDSFLLSLRLFTPTHGDPALYSWHGNHRNCFLLKYVDDLVFTGNRSAILEEFVSKPLSKFEARVILKYDKFGAWLLIKLMRNSGFTIKI